jgi:NAD(P)-dependent dehydrogenase (short-subunit alcohol dehydrogenase family)
LPGEIACESNSCLPSSKDFSYQTEETCMSEELNNKVALITGGTTGIGRDTAVRFAKAGAKVVFTGRREAEGKETLALVKAAGGDGLFILSDVAQSAQVQSAVQKTVEKFGRLDVAFNNAGIEGANAPIIEQSEADYDRTMGINVKGVWLSLKYEMQQMIKQGRGGAIVNMSSVAGFIGSNGLATYCASKHAVLGLTKSAAIEGAPHGIRVNAVCPAVIETPMEKRLFSDPPVHDYMIGLHALRRFGSPAEVAEAVLWMCGSASSFMTGSWITVDGGLMTGPQFPDDLMQK